MIPSLAIDKILYLENKIRIVVILSINSSLIQIEFGFQEIMVKLKKRKLEKQKIKNK